MINHSSKFYPYFLSVLSGLLMSLAWPEIGGMELLIFVAWVPLFYLWEYFKENKQTGWGFLKYSFITFFIWNITCTWWVYFASGWGAATAILLNSLFMSMVFVLAFTLYNKGKGAVAYFVLIPVWLSWEKLHLAWELSWPWLTLGNVFAKQIVLIQWYEFTGHLGGTFWILLVNILMFLTIKKRLWNSKFALLLVLSFALPIMASMLLYFTNKTEAKKTTEIVIVQPNIDPYNEKFSGMSSLEQLRKILRLANQKMTPNTQYVFAPETAIPRNIEEDDYMSYQETQCIDSFLQKNPQIHFITGMNTIKAYFKESEKTSSARKFQNDKETFWLDFYNTASQWSIGEKPQFYHKSKLVPGVEIMPYSFLFSFLNEYAINLGGTSGSLGTQATRDVFTNKKGVKVAPIICYESVYGQYVTEYVKNGANLLAIITNDGWWEDTPGYKQHLAYASLRAIETRRSIVRSANTGISCVVDAQGHILSPTSWWEEDVLNWQVPVLDEKTLYVRWGDYIWYLSFLLLLIPWGFKR